MRRLAVFVMQTAILILLRVSPVESADIMATAMARLSSNPILFSQVLLTPLLLPSGTLIAMATRTLRQPEEVFPLVIVTAGLRYYLMMVLEVLVRQPSTQ